MAAIVRATEREAEANEVQRGLLAPHAQPSRPSHTSRHRFTVEDYYRMSELGILAPGARDQLIDGDIIDMATIGPRHAAAVERTKDVFGAAARGGTRFLVRSQNPVRLGRYSEPQPDVSLVRHRHDYYAGGHPGPADIMLAIEVADSSLEDDAHIKLPSYGRQGVAETWLVDLVNERIEVSRDPGPDGYRSVKRFSRGQALAPLALPDLLVQVEDLIGP